MQESERRCKRRSIWCGVLAGTMLSLVMGAILSVRAGTYLLKAEQPDVGFTIEKTPVGERLLQARCAICHSLDLVTQQRLDLSHWKATLAKMLNWGAELSEEERQILTDYLAARFSPDIPDVTAPSR